MRSSFKRQPPSWLQALVLGLGVFLLVVSAGSLPWGEWLENRALDVAYQTRPLALPVTNILIVGLDEASFQELRRAWPWPRSWHARLIQRLKEAGAKVIVLDLILAEPSEPAEDAALAAALRTAGNVILAQTIEAVADPRFRRQILVSPLPEFAAGAAGVGLALVTPDADGIVRRFAGTLAGRETLALVAARLAQPALTLTPPPTGLINYVGPSRSLECVSYYQVLDPDHPLPAARIRDRIVLVGRMLEASIAPQGQADLFFTPHFALTGQPMAGVEIQGHILHTLLTNTAGRILAPELRYVLYLVLFLGFSYVFARLRPLAGLGYLLLSIGLLFGVSVYLFWHLRLWLPPVLACLGLTSVFGGNTLWHYLVTAREKRWLRQAFSRYVSSSLVDLITAHPERLSLGGEKVEATVLFADLAGFTSLSEELAPEELIQLLNLYFSRMTGIILDYQGTLDKYIGDAIMAFWGAPLSLSKPAVLAGQAALAMIQALGPLQQEWQQQGLPKIEARIGIHTGPVIAGNVGSRDRFNYTIIGDTVNLASRLEGVNKIYGTRLLLSDATYTQVQKDFLCRELDLVQVKGRQQPVVIYELLGPAVDRVLYPWLDTFAAALAAYRQGSWVQADRLFQEVLKERPDDSPSRCFLARLQQHRQPPPHWDGVFHLETK